MAITLPPYRDANLAIDERVSDLLVRMNLEEKAGLLFHNMIRPGPNGELDGPVEAMDILDTRELLEDKQMSHFNLIGPVLDPKMVAKWHNKLQQHVLDHTRLGIPITLSTDPRNHFTSNIGTASKAGVMSQWPEIFGFGALRSSELVRRFADCIRQEYLAVGLRVALHPQADLATEYRWARVNSLFSEDAELAGQLVAAYIEGLQGKLSNSEDGLDSVSTMSKHFPGAGPEMDGEDSHFTYGREQVYPGGKFDYHLEPFRKAIKAGTRQMMPSYAMPIGTQYEEVAFAFNKGIITGLLRQELGFEGIICTDWGLITDVNLLGQDMPARAWGCEHLSELERVVKIFEAGCDQFGGESRPELVIQAVKEGLVTTARVDESVRRVLKEKFILGLFDDKRFIDESKATGIVGKPEFVKLGEAAQRQSFTMLTNHCELLPMPQDKVKGQKIYVEGFGSESLEKRQFTVVSSIADADVALLRLRAPFEPRPGGFESKFHAGSLEFPPEEIRRICHIIDTVPVTVLDIYLDRPAVLTPLVAKQLQVSQAEEFKRSTALVVNYGSSDDAFLDICFNSDGFGPEGKLPFDLPRSMAAVVESREDVAFDTKDPLFRFGFGLEYQKQ